MGATTGAGRGVGNAAGLAVMIVMGLGGGDDDGDSFLGDDDGDGDSFRGDDDGDCDGEGDLPSVLSFARGGGGVLRHGCSLSEFSLFSGEREV